MRIQPNRRREAAASCKQERVLEPRVVDSSDREFRAPLEQLLRAIMTLAGADAAAIRHLEEDTHQLRLVAAVGMPATLLDTAFRVADSCGTCGESVARNAPRHSAKSCSCAIEIGKVTPSTTGHRAFVVPLHHRGAACGVLKLFLPTRRKLPQSLAPLLAALGEMVGLSLENGRLMQKNLQASLNHERHILANEVHDSLAQNLVSMRLRTPLLRDAIDKRDDPRAFRYLDELEESLIVSHRRVRTLITHFRSELDPRGLLHALDEAVAGFREMDEIEVEFENHVACLQLSPEQQLQVFHVVSEALANVMKHAKAQHCRLTIHETDGQYVIAVEDDGIGLASNLDATTEHGHFGLNIMRERVDQLGGHIEFESEAGAGTRIRLCFPATVPEGSYHHE